MEQEGTKVEGTAWGSVNTALLPIKHHIDLKILLITYKALMV